jgi:hypothetical protein
MKADHGQLKRRLRPMRGLKTDHGARIIIAGHAFIQNIRRGHYELGVDEAVTFQVAAAFDELALAILTNPKITVSRGSTSPSATTPDHAPSGTVNQTLQVSKRVDQPSRSYRRTTFRRQSAVSRPPDAIPESSATLLW